MTIGTPYSCEQIFKLREEGLSWGQIGKFYDRSKAAPFIWYKANCGSNPLIESPRFSRLSDENWSIKFCDHTWKNIDYLDKIRHLLSTYLRILIFLPRGTGKSLCSTALISRHVVEERTPILVITSGPASKARLFDAISNILSSQKIKDEYGDIFSSFNSNTCVIKLKPELRTGINLDPVLRVCSRGADIIGSHPAVIWLEDIIQEEFRSEESNENLISWFEGVISFCATHRIGEETRIVGTGTRKSKKDFYYHLIEKLKYPHYTQKAIELVDGVYPTEADIFFDDDGTERIDISKGTYNIIDCPNWPLETLLIEKIRKPYEFRTQMQNSPIDIFGNYFQSKNFREVKWKQTKESQFIIACDPAFGITKASDNTAIVVMAREKNNPRKYIIVEVFAGKIKDIKSILKEIYLRWSPGVLRVIVESNYLQKVFVLDKLNEELPFAVGSFFSRGDKIMRIQSLADPFVSKIRIWDKCEGKEGLYEEYLSFVPRKSTKSRKDDRLDATQMCYETWVRISSSRMPASGRTSSDFIQVMIN